MFDRLTNEIAWCIFIAPHKIARWWLVGILVASIGFLIFWPIGLNTEGPGFVVTRIVLIFILLTFLKFEISLQDLLDAPSTVGVEFNGYSPIENDAPLRFSSKLAKAGLYSKNMTAPESLVYLKVMEDTGFALTGVRLYLERRLRRLAALKKTAKKAKGIEQILGCLQYAKALNSDQVIALISLNTEFNKAAHGVSISDEASMRKWITESSPMLIARMDELIAAVAS